MRWDILPKDFKRCGDQSHNIPHYHLPPKALAYFFLAYSVHCSPKRGVTALSLLCGVESFATLFPVLLDNTLILRLAFFPSFNTIYSYIEEGLAFL